MSAEDHAMLFDIRERIARIESRQVHILEVLTENKAKMDRIEQEAHGLKGRVWLVSTFLYRDWETDRKSTRLNSSHSRASRMPSSA